MYFTRHSIEAVKGAATVERLCDNCHNVAHHVLADQPTGIGVGIPFMKRPFWSSHRAYFLVCPVCEELATVTTDEAQALIRKGAAKS